ncbi:HTH_Tnp_Tc3_2 domain-containing protein [Trichonephila clavipes]|nr:HTH_Tnp_Tc3_2 domain-containing protein [Trichonephila clavipes]
MSQLTKDRSKSTSRSVPIVQRRGFQTFLPHKQKIGSGYRRQTSRRDDRHIVRNARVQRTASSAAIQAHVAPALGVLVSSRTIRRHLDKEHLGSWRPLRVLPLTPTHSTPPFGLMPRTRKLDCSGIEPGRL